MRNFKVLATTSTDFVSCHLHKYVCKICSRQVIRTYCQQRLTLPVFRAWGTAFRHEMTLIWFLLCGEVEKVYLSGNGVSHSSFCTSLVWLQLLQLLSLIVDLCKPRQRHTCHGCPKLAPWHFYKVWKNKWWTSTLLIVANLLSQVALELAQSLHLRAGLHPSTSFVRLFESRTRCAKMLSERRAFCPTVVMVLWDVQ